MPVPGGVSNQLRVFTGISFETIPNNKAVLGKKNFVFIAFLDM